MDKMKMETPNLAQENFEKLAALFPNCVTERQKSSGGGFERAIDFEKLKQMLADHVREGEEAYEFTWVGKKAAIVEANRPIRKTLRPCVEESKDWDTTQNLYIEGDNLEALKLLQESYLGKVKMIYIDPPYNTGNDFIYNDDFKQSFAEYEEDSGVVDEDGNRMKVNHETDGRFHSKWCSMIYSRLARAKDFLTDDGVIFISIDDTEYHNLVNICDEIFGASNYIGTILWKKKTNGNNMGFLPPVHDYILCFARQKTSIKDMGYPLSEEEIAEKFSNPDNDERGPWTVTDLSANHKGPYFPITNPKTGEVHYPADGRYWVFNEKEVEKRIKDGRIIFGKSGNGKPVQKVFAKNRKFSRKRAESWWDDKAMNAAATTELSELFGKAKLFTHPKPSELIRDIIEISTESDDIVMDFFSGSATTAHAMFKMNKSDGGHRKFILVQYPETIEANSVAGQQGYHNICELGIERIDKAGEALKDTAGDLDVGYRVLKVDSSNMNDVYYGAEELTQDLVAQAADNIKSDRSDLDLLFGCLVDWGVELSLPYTSETIDGCTVHDYADGALIACFDRDVPESVIRAIAKRQPERAVFRDSSFADSPAKINVTEIFKLLSPDTDVRVL